MERRCRVPRASAASDARRNPIVRTVARVALRDALRRPRTRTRGGSAVGPLVRPRASDGGSFDGAVDLREDGDGAVPHGLAEAGGEPSRGGAAQVHHDEDETRPHQALLHAQERGGGDDRVPTLGAGGRGEDDEGGEEADRPPRDRDALAPVPVRETAHDEVADGLEHRERDEERGLAPVGFPEELPPRRVEHGELVELEGAAEEDRERARDDELREVKAPGREESVVPARARRARAVEHRAGRSPSLPTRPRRHARRRPPREI